MIKSMTINNLQVGLDFAWELCETLSTSSYPIKKTKEDLKQSLLENLTHKDDQVLMYFKDNQLIGIIELYVEVEEKYIRLGSYIKEDLEEIMDEIISYLQRMYPYYTIHFTYPKENTVALEYLESKGYLCIEASNDLRLETKDLPFEDTDRINFERLKKEEFMQYATFHDQHGGEEMYWNSKRLYEAFDRWYIYVYKKGKSIVASTLTCQSGEESIEIFGLFLDDIQDRAYIAKELLRYTIHSILEIGNGTKQVIYFVEDKDLTQYAAARELGFQEMGSFRCYEHVLS